MDYSLPDFSVHGILQARMLEWVAVLFSRGFSKYRDWTWVSCITGRFSIVSATREAPKCLGRELKSDKIKGNQKLTLNYSRSWSPDSGSVGQETASWVRACLRQKVTQRWNGRVLSPCPEIQEFVNFSEAKRLETLSALGSSSY